MVNTGEQHIPKWLSGKLTQAGLETIRAAVIAAEARTTGEIVPVLARRTVPSTTSSLLFFAGATATYLLVRLMWLERDMTKLLEGAEWIEQTFPAWGVDAIAIVTIGLVSFLLRRSSLMITCFTAKRDREILCRQRAELEFHLAGIGRTKARTGVLIFVSMDEHQVDVVADISIAARVTADAWVTVANSALEHLRRGDVSRAFATAIEKAADVLATEFPLEEGDHNELPDGLLIRE